MTTTTASCHGGGTHTPGAHTPNIIDPNYDLWTKRGTNCGKNKEPRGHALINHSLLGWESICVGCRLPPGAKTEAANAPAPLDLSQQRFIYWVWVSEVRLYDTRRRVTG